MNVYEHTILNTIISKVQRRIDTDTWDNGGYCSLGIQSIADMWGISRAIVQRCINTLELAGIVSVQRRYGSTHTITLTPHTEWVEVNFQELRTPSKKQRVSPATPSHLVEDTNTTPNTPDTNTPATVVVNTTDTPATPSAWVEDTRYPYRIRTNTPATPSADTPPNTTDTPATVTGGNGKKQLPIPKRKVSPTPATNTPPATNGLPYTPPTEADSLRFNNDKNGKKLGKKLGVSPTPDTPATPSAWVEDTPATNTTDTPPIPATPSADTDTTPDTPDTPATDTTPDTDT